ncbi:retinoschisin-like [Asterias rubens]|uniref:retinoschisin-like n=1 Tax=Asterias rubens TaxID=7604 RepID=UPI001455D041|nr:retinoschisin-like [Asterias rubens]
MAPLSSSVFLFFEMLLAVSASYSVSGLYGGVSYQPVEHHALRGQSFRDISGISAVLCSARCLSHHGCFSFNYDHINRVCQMNNVTRQQKCDHFQRMQSFTYYDATAKPRNCQNNTVSSDGESSTLSSTSVCCLVGRLGVEDGSIPDESLSASSNWFPEPGVGQQFSTPAGGRLNKIPTQEDIIGAWHPNVSDANQWIQVDLVNPTFVTGVLTQGRSDHPQWVTKYKVQYQPPSQESFADVQDHLGHTEEFIGNTNKLEIVDRRFFEPVLANKLRIVPVEWNGNNIALRFELIGCE